MKVREGWLFRSIGIVTATAIGSLGLVVSLGAALPSRAEDASVKEAGYTAIGYRLAGRDGSSYSYSGGGVAATGPMRLAQPVVGMASTPDGGGYWLVASDGGVFSFGDASFHGSTGAIHLAQPVVGMASTPDGGGYWLVASDGGVFTFGDAPFYGSASGSASAPVVGLSRPTTQSLPPPGPPASGAEFDQPSGVASVNGNLWVTNQAGNSLTEIAPTVPARWISTLYGPAYGFASPSAVVGYGNKVFVANARGSVTEVSAVDGSAIQILAGPQYGFADPVALAVEGTTLLVLNGGPAGGSGSITEIDADTGAVTGIISGAAYSFSDPVAMTVAGGDLYVADEKSDSVTDVAIAGGALRSVVTGGGLAGPDGIAYGSGYVWVSNSTTSTATQISTATDAPAVFSSGSYGFGAPSAMVESNGYVYVLSPFGWSPMVTKLDEATGAASWYMCNTNGPYYFSNLSALTTAGGAVWVVSANGVNYPDSRAATGSLTELLATDGSLIQTVP